MPTTANPPNPIVDPSAISRTASSKVANTFDLGIIPPSPNPRHPGEGRDLLVNRANSGSLGPGLRRDEPKLAQLLAFDVSAEEDVRLEEHRQHQGAVRRARGVAVAFGPPHVIAG